MNASTKFRCVEDEILPVRMNIVIVGQHAGNVEKSINTVNHGTRMNVHRLPYRRYPTTMVKGYDKKLSTIEIVCLKRTKTQVQLVLPQ